MVESSALYGSGWQIGERMHLKGIRVPVCLQHKVHLHDNTLCAFVCVCLRAHIPFVVLKHLCKCICVCVCVYDGKNIVLVYYMSYLKEFSEHTMAIELNEPKLSVWTHAYVHTHTDTHRHVDIPTVCL